MKHRPWRLLRPIVDVREDETINMLLMFAYSFLAMTAYNIVKPLATAKFIADLGADNLPYVLLVSGVVIGVVMAGYTRAISRLSRRLIIPLTQAALAALLLLFWFLFTAGQGHWASVAVYFYRLITGILLISQFWTLANDIYDPRQAKRLFGFIGGGATLGGLTASLIVAFGARAVGTNNLLLLSAGVLVACMVCASTVLHRTRSVSLARLTSSEEHRGVGAWQAIEMLRGSKHLQLIALVIGFASLAAFLIETQLNLAAEASQGPYDDRIAALLGTVQAWTSGLGFVIQIWLVSRIQRYLGIGFALLILPISLGLSGGLILVTGAAAAAGLARVLDTSLRYTVDKTTREILFLPLSVRSKYLAKPFLDVTVDRGARGISAVLVLVLIKPWGLGWSWRQLSLASLTIMALWIYSAIRARGAYRLAFRKSIEEREVEAAEVRLPAADLSTVEMLVQELGAPEEHRVLYAIDILEALDKQRLVTPLLLHHASPRVRARALEAFSTGGADLGAYRPTIERLMTDESLDVRAAAVRSMAAARNGKVADMVRPYLSGRDPRLASAAAVCLAQSQRDADLQAAEAALACLMDRTGDGRATGRREVAAAVGRIAQPRFHALLIPLLYDSDRTVAEQALESVRRVGTADYIFVPALVTLLGQRRSKASAREVLVSYGEGVIESLAYFLRDRDEHISIRRRIPSTMARIPAQQTADVLLDVLKSETDGALRSELMTAVAALHRQHPNLAINRTTVEEQLQKEVHRHNRALTRYFNLTTDGVPADALVVQLLAEKVERALDRVFLLLGLLYPWKDVAAAHWAIEHGDSTVRNSAVEYLDNLLDRRTRRLVIPLVDDGPIEDKVRRANGLLRAGVRLEGILHKLVHEEDPIAAAAAVSLARERGFDSPSFRATSTTEEGIHIMAAVDRLRRIPLFSKVWINDLFELASAGRLQSFEAGHEIYRKGVVLTSYPVLLEGTVELGAGASSRRVEGPSTLAFEAGLEGAPVPETARAASQVLCLVIPDEEGMTLLSENRALVEGLFSTVIERPAFRDRRVLVRGEVAAGVSQLTADGLLPIEKALVFERLSLCASFSTEELLHVAAIARETPVEAGVELFTRSDARAFYILLEGKVRLVANGQHEIVADEGDVIGLYETLAGVPVGWDGLGMEHGTALRVTRDDLYDLVAHRPELLRQMLTAMFRTGSVARQASSSEPSPDAPPVAAALRGSAGVRSW